IDARNNGPTDQKWFKSLTPGWQRRRMENFAVLVSGGAQDEDLVSDGWTDLLRKVPRIATKAQREAFTAEEIAQKMELADFRQMNHIRQRIDEIVQDKKTADALKPWFRQMCKRPTFNDDYLPTFNRPNVHLVDTLGRGVDRITEKGLIFDGIEYEVDCIIFGTGFEVGTSFSRRLGFEVYGRDGKPLGEHFKEGTRTLHGFSSHGFPNYFNIGLRQTGFRANFVDMLTGQMEHLQHLLSYAQQNGIKRIEPTAQGEAAWVTSFNEKIGVADEFLSQCTPGYYNAEGNVKSRSGLFGEVYGGGPMEFSQILQDWRTKGDFEGLELR
ncbi:MAG: monooxygenase, partial [Janthinobacterium lividum]